MPDPIVDLNELLASLSVSRREGFYCVATVPAGTSLEDGVEALIVEDEGTTAIATLERAQKEGWDHEFESAWLTLDVLSALEAVGLTAAVAAALTEAGIPCNVLAARRHDHILVPVERVEEAISAIEALSCRDDR